MVVQVISNRRDLTEGIFSNYDGGTEMRTMKQLRN
jgi:hypothetical protein